MPGLTMFMLSIEPAIQSFAFCSSTRLEMIPAIPMVAKMHADHAAAATYRW
jgi:hypothetical protein